MSAGTMHADELTEEGAIGNVAAVALEAPHLTRARSQPVRGRHSWTSLTSTPLDEIGPGGVDVVDDHLETLDGAGRHLGKTSAERLSQDLRPH